MAKLDRMARLIILLLSLGSVIGEYTVSYRDDGQAVCPSHHNVILRCSVEFNLNSITWKYGCQRSVVATLSLSDNRDVQNRMAQINCNNVMFSLFFTFFMTNVLTMSNVTVIGEVISPIQNNISMFLECGDSMVTNEIKISGPPPPPHQWIFRVHSESFNTTHYLVLLSWSHPHQNNTTSSPITYYILKFDRNIEQRFSEIIIVDNDASNITLWCEFNTMYNVSLQSENCGSLWRSLPQFKEVYQSAPNISMWYSSPPSYFRSYVSSEIFNHTHYCVTFFWLPPSDINLTFVIMRYNLTIWHSSDESTITETPASTQVQKDFNKTFLLDYKVLNYTLSLKCNQSYVISLRSEFDRTIQSTPLLMEDFQSACISNAEFTVNNNITTNQTTTTNTVPVLISIDYSHLIIGVVVTTFFLLTSVVAVSLIIFTRVQISHTKLLYRGTTVEESIYSNPQSTSELAQTPIGQQQHELSGADGNSNILYEEIEMSRRPVQPDHHNLAELPHHSVLTAPSVHNEPGSIETHNEPVNMETTDFNDVGDDTTHDIDEDDRNTAAVENVHQDNKDVASEKSS